MHSGPVVSIDVRKFDLINSIDTCAIWNILSSVCLARASRQGGVLFIVADYVKYEALRRQRKEPSEADLKMQELLRSLLDNASNFSSPEGGLTADDLRAVIEIVDVTRLGRGEIAALALALKLRAAFLSDDQRARRAARGIGAGAPQTTPHLLGWLLFKNKLSDGDFHTVIAEHEANIPPQRGRLTPYFTAAYHEACRCKLSEQRSAR